MWRKVDDICMPYFPLGVTKFPCSFVNSAMMSPGVTEKGRKRDEKGTKKGRKRDEKGTKKGRKREGKGTKKIGVREEWGRSKGGVREE